MESYSKNIMPCAACKLLRRRCTKDCIFLPYFPPSEPEKFAAVHRIFGASNISKMLQEIPVNDREDAVISLVYEATTRLKEPVYGCASLISSLQMQIFHLQSKLNEALAETVTLKTQLANALSIIISSQSHQSNHITDKNNFNLIDYQQQSECNINDNASYARLLDLPVTDSYLEHM
ncbi:LOB domain-containing protein 25-like [Forsythia ovata]|uniref:LOB domain-containing protein 25-like n=1 Tax=Forsythia ovata TaxID=205694 RepID=A0ABD1T5W6_9LAMI